MFACSVFEICASGVTGKTDSQAIITRFTAYAYRAQRRACSSVLNDAQRKHISKTKNTNLKNYDYI